jgi:hypothetical protein
MPLPHQRLSTATQLRRMRLLATGIAGSLVITTRLVLATLGTLAIGHDRPIAAPSGLVRATLAAVIIGATGVDKRANNPLANCLRARLRRKGEWAAWKN